MCRQPRLGLVFLLASLVFIGAPCVMWGQTQTDYRARVQALVPVWRRMIALKRYEDSVAMRALPDDTLREGPLVLLTDQSLMPFVRQVAKPVAAALERRFGPATDALRAHVYVVSTPAGDSTGNAVNLAEVDSVGRPQFFQGEPWNVAVVSYALLQHNAGTLSAELGSNFGWWLGGNFPADTATAAMWTGVRIDLVTSSFATARACYAGARSSCALALGVAGEDDPAMRWLDARERRDRIRHMRYQLRSDNEQEFDHCVNGGDDAPCVNLLHLVPLHDLYPPLGPSARQSLVALALDLGGPDAFSRMHAAPDTRSAQLAAAAGIPIDSLIRVWRRRVLGARTSNPSMSWGVALASLMWVVTCGALSLRSSPWR